MNIWQMMICKHLYRLKVYINRRSEVPYFICSGEHWGRAVAGTLLLVSYMGCFYWCHFRNWAVVKTATFLLHLDGEKGKKKPLCSVENFTWESQRRKSTNAGVWVFPSHGMWRFAGRQFVPLNYLKKKTNQTQLVFTEQNLGALFILSDL